MHIPTVLLQSIDDPQAKHYTVNDIKPDPTRYQYTFVYLAQLTNPSKACPSFPLGMIKGSEFGRVNLIIISVQAKNVRLHLLYLFNQY